VDVRRLIERALEPLQIPLEIKKQRLVIHGGEGASFTGDLNWSAEALTTWSCIEHTPEWEDRDQLRCDALYAEIISATMAGIANGIYRPSSTASIAVRT
jgi:hypothetical protein